jgi:hypothetical protein
VVRIASYEGVADHQSGGTLVSDLDETTHYFAASGSTGLRIDDLQLLGTYRWTAHVQSAVRARRIGWWPSHRFELQFDLGLTSTQSRIANSIALTKTLRAGRQRRGYRYGTVMVAALSTTFALAILPVQVEAQSCPCKVQMLMLEVSRALPPCRRFVAGRAISGHAEVAKARWNRGRIAQA